MSVWTRHWRYYDTLPQMMDQPDTVPLDSHFKCARCSYTLRGLAIKTRCPKCGHTVVTSILETPHIEGDGPVQLYGGRDAMEAHFVRHLLEDAKIHARVMGEELSIARGDLPLTPQTLPSVSVSAGDVDRASPIVIKYLLKTYRNGVGELVNTETWQCPSCGETIEGQFGACWNCQINRPT